MKKGSGIERLFADKLRAALRETGVSARAAALSHGLPVRAIQGILEEHSPSLGRADEVCRALEITLVLGPSRIEPTVKGRVSASRNKGFASDRPKVAPVPPAAHRDRGLAELLSAICDHWEDLNDYGRRDFAANVYRVSSALGRRKSKGD